ncbi:MAG: hypothetical protein DLM70_13365 [Chloroflexi bacterium]|nr:MAG: hypothetical protein DLM70_13365 [Chloroflexota bacterium]
MHANRQHCQRQNVHCVVVQHAAQGLVVSGSLISEVHLGNLPALHIVLVANHFQNPHFQVLEGTALEAFSPQAASWVEQIDVVGQHRGRSLALSNVSTLQKRPVKGFAIERDDG